MSWSKTNKSFCFAKSKDTYLAKKDELVSFPLPKLNTHYYPNVFSRSRRTFAEFYLLPHILSSFTSHEAKKNFSSTVCFSRNCNNNK